MITAINESKTLTKHISSECKWKFNGRNCTVCSCHVTYVFQSESTLYSCLNVKELLAQNRHEIWSLSDSNPLVVGSSPVAVTWRNCNSDQWWKNDKCWCECKKCYACEKDYVWNPVTCNCENGNYLASTMDDSVIMCDEIIGETVPTSLNENKAKCKMQNFDILLAFFLITIALLIAVSIYCHLIK